MSLLVINVLSFWSSGKVLLSFLKDSSAVYKILGSQSFLSEVWICHLTAVRPPIFLMRSCSYYRCSLVHDLFFSSYFQDFLFHFVFWLFYCVSACESLCILCVVHWTSWMFSLIFFRKFGKFWAIIYSHFFGLFFLLSFE